MPCCSLEVESSRNVIAHVDARGWGGEWRGNWRMEWVASTLHTTSEHGVLLPLMRTTRLPVVGWTDAPADLNGLVCFAERRNLVSARVPSRFKRSLQVNTHIFPVLKHDATLAHWRAEARLHSFSTIYCWAKNFLSKGAYCSVNWTHSLLPTVVAKLRLCYALLPVVASNKQTYKGICLKLCAYICLYIHKCFYVRAYVCVLYINIYMYQIPCS